ncbi:MAG TPA: phenylacetate--CoA ligase, partial [Thermodesulfobacterium commune]|nr:phenylacetate--CoA ligase [Thermodesulfobacterium commune]
MFWDQQLECIDQEKLREIQLQRLKEVVRRVYEKVPFYRKKFDEAGIKPEDIRSLEDIKYLPFTSKTDMREAYPFGLFAVPLSEIVEIHTSSGTTGKPVVAGYTVKDIALWA